MKIAKRWAYVGLPTFIICGFLLYTAVSWKTLTDQTSISITAWTDLDAFKNTVCDQLFAGHVENKSTNVSGLNSNLSKVYAVLETDCAKFMFLRKYITHTTVEEDDFPIAYSIVMFKDFEQFERLLRAVYRPSNHYCIHVDGKASPALRKTVLRLAECLPRVFVAPEFINVTWGKLSVLNVELVCIKHLLKRKSWRYFINLTGQEFPLKTNRELVQILQAYNGSNDIDGTVKRIPDRVERWRSAGRLPHGIRPVKGSVHIIANRQFMDYAIHNQVAKDLYKWTSRTRVPDETFFSTLNHNPQLKIPGSYIGEPETNSMTKPFLARYKVWSGEKCNGKFVHYICIFGIGDLYQFPARKELFANKFYLDYQSVTLDCMDYWYDSLIRAEMAGHQRLDLSYYEQLGFVKNQVRS